MMKKRQELPQNVIPADYIEDYYDEVRGRLVVEDIGVVRTPGFIGDVRVSTIGRVEVFPDEMKIYVARMDEIPPLYNPQYDCPMDDMMKMFDAIIADDMVLAESYNAKVVDFQAPLAVEFESNNFTHVESKQCEETLLSSTFFNDLKNITLVNPSRGTLWRVFNRIRTGRLRMRLSDVSVLLTNIDPKIHKQESDEIRNFNLTNQCNIQWFKGTYSDISTQWAYFGFSPPDPDKFDLLRCDWFGFEFNPMTPVSAKVIHSMTHFADHINVWYKRKGYNCELNYYYSPSFKRYPPDSFKCIMQADERMSVRDCFNFITNLIFPHVKLTPNMGTVVFPDKPLVLQGVVPYTKEEDGDGILYGRTLEGEFVVDDFNILLSHEARVEQIKQYYSDPVRPPYGKIMDSVSGIHYSMQMASPIIYGEMKKPTCCDVERKFVLRTMDPMKCHYISATGVMFCETPNGNFPLDFHTCGVKTELYSMKIEYCGKRKRKKMRAQAAVSEDEIFDKYRRTLSARRVRLKQAMELCEVELRSELRDEIYGFDLISHIDCLVDDVQDNCAIISGLDLFPLNMIDRERILVKLPFEHWQSYERETGHSVSLANSFRFVKLGDSRAPHVEDDNVEIVNEDIDVEDA